MASSMPKQVANVERVDTAQVTLTGKLIAKYKVLNPDVKQSPSANVPLTLFRTSERVHCGRQHTTVFLSQSVDKVNWQGVMARASQDVTLTFEHSPDDLDWMNEWQAEDDVLVHCFLNSYNYVDKKKKDGSRVYRTDFMITSIEKLFPDEDVVSQEEVELQHLAEVEKNNRYVK